MQVDEVCAVPDEVPYAVKQACGAGGEQLHLMHWYSHVGGGWV